MFSAKLKSLEGHLPDLHLNFNLSHAIHEPSMSSTTTLPSVEAFKRMGWIPESRETYIRWLGKFLRDLRPHERVASTLLPPVQQFKNFVETNSVVYTEFVRMFEEVKKSDDAELLPTDFPTLIEAYDKVIRSAPQIDEIGPPMYMIMSHIMNTNAGFSAFTKENLNRHYKDMFNSWARYLASSDSRASLNDGPGGWGSEEALTEVLVTEETYPGRTFDQVFICSPGEPYMGYASFDDFFVRRFREPGVDRPLWPPGVTPDPTDLRPISAPCESLFIKLSVNVKKHDDNFIIKGDSYSLVHLLANDPSTDLFVGGAVFQTLLGTRDYHRWHAPVNGTIKRIIDVPGTYFAQAPSLIGSEEDPDTPPAFVQSLPYFSHTAARQIIFIEADNPSIGLMCFIAIGMTEISSCEATVSENQHVNRGDELGMFHFGGSSSAMVFRKESGIKFVDEAIGQDALVRINEIIAFAL